jgi:hypothetical protein
MKNKELIRILEILDPEEETYFQTYDSEDHQEDFAKAAVMIRDILYYLMVSNVTIEESYKYNKDDEKIKTLEANIVLVHRPFSDIVEYSQAFDNAYKKRKKK